MDPYKKELMEIEKKRQKKIKTMQKVVAGTMTATMLSGAIAVGSLIYDANKTEQKKHNIKDDYVTVDKQTKPQKTQSKKIDSKTGISLKSYNGTKYYTMSEEYTLQIARESLDRVEKLLKENVPGLSPVGGNKDFYPSYYDEYMLTGLAYTESSYRICREDGTPLTSKDGALGPMQILPSTVNYVNYWLKDVMEVKGVEFTTIDLINPEKAMDIANLYLISCAKNYAKATSNNSLFKVMKEDFSVERQQELIIAMYNEGPGNMLSHAKSGTIKQYLKEGSKTNYLNKVLTNAETIKENSLSNYN